jgi:hypothetical protein
MEENDETEASEQIIEAPAPEDTEDLARKLIHANEMVVKIAGTKLCGSEEDLDGIQAVLNSNTIEPEAIYSLEALGVAFGRVFIENHAAFDWWMVIDETGRDPAIRYKESSMLLFPQDMILKRIEDG